jgi:hypothetical protein
MMGRRSRSPLHRIAPLLGAWLLLSAGCGKMSSDPTSPVLGGSAGLEPLIEVSPTTVRKPQTVSVGLKDGSALSVNVLVRADVGGVVESGRHRLTIPPYALEQDTEITLVDVSMERGYVACEAYPEGLQFQKPARLESSFKDLKDPAGYSIFWVRDPGTRDEEWIDMRAGLNADGTGLVAMLTHFSTYAPGKAGWTPRRSGPGRVRPDEGK